MSNSYQNQQLTSWAVPRPGSVMTRKAQCSRVELDTVSQFVSELRNISSYKRTLNSK